MCLQYSPSFLFCFPECSGGSTSRCNCGGVADEMSTDEGMLTDKDRLPVMALHFMRTAPSGELLFQVGSLECMGDDVRAPTDYENP